MALALGGADAAGLHERTGDLRTLVGDYAGALSSYDSAAAECRPEQLSRIEHKSGGVHQRRGEWERAQARFAVALEALGQDDAGLRARILTDLSLTLHHARAPERAAALADEAREVARTSTTRPAAARRRWRTSSGRWRSSPRSAATSAPGSPRSGSSSAGSAAVTVPGRTGHRFAASLPTTTGTGSGTARARGVQMSRRRRNILKTMIAALGVAAALGPNAAAMPVESVTGSSDHASQDLRSPDARDAAPVSVAAVRHDLRSPDARDVATAAGDASRQFAKWTAYDRAVRSLTPVERTAAFRAGPASATTATSIPTGTDWGDVAIGAGGALALMLIGLGGLALAVRHRDTSRRPVVSG
jgi:tetratricopeptide (TPR) repeat protein